MTEPNVNTVQEQDLHQFTPEQIEDYCEQKEKTYDLLGLPDIALTGVRIIRQLQGELCQT